MAGDWIKMRGNLWDDPRIAKLCDLTEASEASIIGGLYWLWSAADQHTENGFMPGLTLRSIDRKTGVDGLASALVSIGWIAVNDDGIEIINFNDHNGQSAKRRCTDAQRKATVRNVSADEVDKEQTNDGQNRQMLGAREEKRREDIKTITPDGVSDSVFKDFIKLRKGLKAPVTETALNGLRKEADKAHLPLQTVLELCCQNGWRGFKAEWIKSDTAASNQLKGFVNA